MEGLFDPATRRVGVHAPLTPTIFHEDWWLQAASGGRIEQVEVRSGNVVVGRLPYLRRRHFGLLECVMPELTPYLGPAIAPPLAKPAQMAQSQRSITADLIRQLPTCDRFHQCLHSDVPDALAFAYRDFASEAQFTMDVEPAPEPELWKSLRDKTRNVIRRARETHRLVSLEPGSFVRLYDRNLHAQGRGYNYMWRQTGVPVMQAAVEHGQCRIDAIADLQGRVVAASVCVWDMSREYLLLTTRDPGSHAGCVSWLIWESLARASRANRVFDFGGIGTPGSVAFYTSFGATVRTRFAVHRTSRLFRTVDFGARKARAAWERARRHLLPDCARTTILSPAAEPAAVVVPAARPINTLALPVS
ncbi:GNAT family N-acetyltransferase [Sphingomonas aracearum]|uniref:GNAT family N-acetyltransferase n=1 Tax=Sphingomonas aracearum TaxID=2283317 RepID=A0A369W2L6_9SPHN|nr:GNAT family N-acetyltransferase [Sphingomonas aracearum]